MARQQVQHLSDDITLSTLADNTAIIANTNIDSTREQGVRIKKFKYSVVAEGLTTLEIPLIYGLAIELTVVEIAEAMNADPQGIDDTAAVDFANRKVLALGNVRNAFPSNGSGAEDPGNSFRSVRIPWDIPEGSTLKWWVMNRTGSALTTGGIVHFNAVTVQEWLRD